MFSIGLNYTLSHERLWFAPVTGRSRSPPIVTTLPGGGPFQADYFLWRHRMLSVRFDKWASSFRIFIIVKVLLTLKFMCVFSIIVNILYILCIVKICFVYFVMYMYLVSLILMNTKL